tara:strand:+ start:179 stop:433 length:255 start_codon:yes stop_codon:yes gene_type:complete
MESDSNTTGYIVGLAGTIIGTLASAVAFLFKLLDSKNSSAIVDLQTRVACLDTANQECREDRENLRVELATVKSDLCRKVDKPS